MASLDTQRAATLHLTLSGSDYVEHVVRLPRKFPTILAMGAWFNNTVCLILEDHAYISKSVGHLDSPGACRQHECYARELLTACSSAPLAIAHDLHPDFHSSRFAAQLSTELDVPLIAVQHHHAHIAAVCAEHNCEIEVLGLALDGVGLGSDNTAWGGELLRIRGASSSRIGNLRPIPLAGGDRAAQEPWRVAAGVLHELGRSSEIPLRYHSQAAADIVQAMLLKNLNCPRTSSMGRVFDAAAGLLGLCDLMQFDAQAAIALEKAATQYIHTQGWPDALSQGWHINEDAQLDLLPTLGYLADEKDIGRGAAIFHRTLTVALCEWVLQISQKSNIKTVAIGGGCFFNQLLKPALVTQLQASGITILTSKTLLPGDTSISFGQAWVAAKQQYHL